MSIIVNLSISVALSNVRECTDVNGRWIPIDCLRFFYTYFENMIYDLNIRSKTVSVHRTFASFSANWKHSNGTRT